MFDSLVGDLLNYMGANIRLSLGAQHTFSVFSIGGPGKADKLILTLGRVHFVLFELILVIRAWMHP